MMIKSRLSPREIVQRLQMIETLTAEGLPIAEALRSVGMREAEYDRWRVEYNGLGRTLGPLRARRRSPRRDRAAPLPLIRASRPCNSLKRERPKVVGWEPDMQC